MDPHSTETLIKVLNHYLGGSESSTKAEYLCPFHNDNNPSLFVLPKTERYPKAKYQCRSCGVHDDVFGLIKHFEDCDFKKAQTILFGGEDFQDPEPKLAHIYATFEDDKPIPLTKFFLPEQPMVGLTRDGYEVVMHGTCHPGQRVALCMKTVPSRQASATWIYLRDVQKNTKRWRIWKRQYQRNCMLAQLRVMDLSGTTYEHELAAIVEHV